MEVNPKPVIQGAVPALAKSPGTGVQSSKGADKPQSLPKGNSVDALKAAYGEKKLKEMGIIECATCAARVYVDGSNDPGVSFKTPGKIAPEASAAVVMSHEMEHVSNERADAQANDREIVSQSVILTRDICPECGRSYISGGTTRTVTQKASTYDPSNELLKGTKMDLKV